MIRPTAMCRYIILFLGLAVVWAGLPTLGKVHAADLGDEYDGLRQRWYEMLTGGNYDPADPDIASAILAITNKAQSNWETISAGPGSRTYLWSDLANGATNPTHIRLSYLRLYEMALAYRTNGSSLEGNSAIRDSVLDGLQFLNETYYNNTVTPYGNWWEWQIGAPLALNDTVVLLYDELPSSAVSTYMDAIKHFVAGPRDTGANRVWSCAVAVGRGILTKDGATIKRGVDGLSPVFDYVTSGDGFYEDGSFIQHEKFAYNGSYGLSLIENLSTVLYFVTGSSWDVTDPDAANAYRWVDDSFIPFVYKGALMDMVRGRDISVFSREDHETGHRMAAALLRMAQSAEPADAARYKSVIKYWLLNDTSHNFYEGLSLDFIRQAKAMLNDSTITPAPEPIASKLYPAMDRALHLRPGFGVGVSMFSKRIANYETTNGQNLKGWYTGAGMTYLYNGDSDQYGGNFWPTVNSYRLPGTTAVAGKTMLAESLNHQTWVGGTSLGDEYSVVGMSFEHVDADITADMSAKKSWFMFDDEVVALGTGITSTYPSNDVETIVENRRLNAAGDNALTVNGVLKSSAAGWTETMTGVKWAHLAGSTAGADIGYYFPGVATLEGLREERSGKWFDISKYTGVLEPGDPTHTNRFLNLYLNHGTAPTDASYAYALLPGKTASEVNSYTENPDFIVLANNSGVQAVKEKTLGVMGANFWTNSEQTVDMLTSSGKAAVMVREKGDSSLSLSVSDPNQPASGVVTLKLAKSAKSVIAADPRITVNRLSPYIQLTVDVGGSLGRKIEASFELEPSSETVIEAENYASANKPTRTVTTDVSGNYHISGSDGTWMSYTGLDFGDRTDSMTLRMATANTGGTIELRLDSTTGPLIGSHPVTSTGSWSTWTNVEVPLTGASGVHDLYIMYVKKTNTLGVAALNWFSFRAGHDTSDKTPPVIVLAADRLEPTDQDVTVTASVYDDGGIGVKKWAYGNQPASYFADGGIPFDHHFAATINGVYTVYAQDLSGNEAVRTIEVWNITRGAPTILLVPNPSSPTNGRVNVVAAVSVTSGLQEMKYDWGQLDTTYFKTGGISQADPAAPIEVSENGWLTVYVKDGIGNERTKQIEISNIDRDKPVITLRGDAVTEVAYGSVYRDAGADATDTFDGDISANVRVGGDAVDTGAPGHYVIHYDVTDRAGNAAERVSRTVIVLEGSDTQPPAWPAGSSVTVSEITPMSVKLSWPYAEDATGVAGYRIYKGDAELATVGEEAASYTVTGLAPDNKYDFKVTAFDTKGNENSGMAVAVYTLRVSGGCGSCGGGSVVIPAPPSSNAGLNQVELRVGGESLPLVIIDQNGKRVYWAETNAEWAMIEANPADSGATYQLKKIASDAQGRIQLQEGDNAFELEVRAADGSVKAYAVIIRRTIPKPPNQPENPGMPEEPAAELTDLSGHWAQAAIYRARQMGIVDGYSNGTFLPNAFVTRAEFAVMLTKALGLEGGEAQLEFTDRAAIGGWAVDAVSAAVQAGVISGYEDGSFRPGDSLTRAEMVTMIMRALRLPSGRAVDSTGFADDAEIPNWAKTAAAASRELGIVNGRAGSRFVPNDRANRAEAVVMLLRMLDQPSK
ncbi:polysaccharide lyase family 8 super-sandwich domain-containing protein [Cohnella hongkongensis]|uniref:Polysaccharide lyase family 8 super-sandwich domain-containing protein n=1 Tax=Cohnella hongkongensis TaxID=178337 RepID=A0ABV9F783_9BACL